MFRESDEKPKVLHPTFTTKPVPILQAISQVGKFDDDARSTSSSRNALNSEIPAVPVTRDTYYDPSHPDADWAGLVSKTQATQKKHSQDHRSQQSGIRMEEGGIISAEEKKEFSRRPGNIEAAIQNHGSIVIAGINSDNDRWKTSYKSFEQQEGTSKEQLILVKRMGSRKPLPDPAQAQSSRPTLNAEDSYFQNGNEYVQSKSGAIGVYNPAASNRARSFLTNIGGSIMDKVPDFTVSPAPSVDARSMLSSNYNPYPGYTGKKKY